MSCVYLSFRMSSIHPSSLLSHTLEELARLNKQLRFDSAPILSHVTCRARHTWIVLGPQLQKSRHDCHTSQNSVKQSVKVDQTQMTQISTLQGTLSFDQAKQVAQAPIPFLFHCCYRPVSVSSRCCLYLCIVRERNILFVIFLSTYLYLQQSVQLYQQLQQQLLVRLAVWQQQEQQ